MKYKLATGYDISVKKIQNGFIVVTSHPDHPGIPQTFFATELEAYEFAAHQIADVIEELKNGKSNQDL